MIFLGAPVSTRLCCSSMTRAKSRMSRKDSRKPLVQENAHIHELLIKCAKPCSQLVSKDTI